ncbi:hypothetical protein ETD83_05150 [Actinomadura soli]|uniref:Uncharacterized protein n=1 Tax=Actinomadura soli TaxID=2508997 RepID=A0A5C4JIE4_9ACTN|nr:hypothetical protein ETD83_05150 [Actinomadura soli]
MLAALGLGGAATVAAILIGGAPTVFAPIVAAFWAVFDRPGGNGLPYLPHHPDLARDRRAGAVHPAAPVTLARRKGGARNHPGAEGANESLFLLDAHGKLLIRVGVDYYKREEVDRLVQMLDVPCSGPDYFGSAKEFTKTYPGLVSWIERHPYRIAFAIASVVLAVTIAMVLVSVTTAA